MLKYKYNVLEGPSQSLDLNIIENVWIDLKQAVYSWKPRNLTELETFFYGGMAQYTTCQSSGTQASTDCCGKRGSTKY